MTMYAISIENDEVRTYPTLSRAKSAANGFADRRVIEVEVTVVETGTVAYVATYVAGRSFNPWERVETPVFAAPAIAGYRTAYTRRRIQATVYRALTHAGWLVHDGRTGGVQVCKTTREACQLTSSMREGVLLPAN